MKDIQSYLPIFTGFYNTIFDPQYDYELDQINSERQSKGLEIISYDHVHWQYKEAIEKIAKECTNHVQEVINEILNTDIKVVYESIYSPRQYNFGNDSINVTYKLTDTDIEKIVDYLKDNDYDFDQYLRNRYTSISGLISHYSNDSKIWINLYCKELEDSQHYIGTLFDFIIKNEDDDARMSMYYYISDHDAGYVYAKNYEELIK